MLIKVRPAALKGFSQTDSWISPEFTLYIVFFCSSVTHLESLRHERDALQLQLQSQKFTPADVERINREKRELIQTISILSKSLEDAEQQKWNEEISLAKVQEKVYREMTTKVDIFQSSVTRFLPPHCLCVVSVIHREPRWS